MLIIVVLTILTSTCSIAQSPGRFELLEQTLRALTDEMPGLTQEIVLTVSDLSLQEFLRNIANSTSLNINIDKSVNGSVTNNFTNVPAVDVILFICMEFELDISVTGKIISIYKYISPQKPIPCKKISITYDSVQNLLSMDLYNDSLTRVLKEITDITHRNIIPRPELNGKMVSVYFRDMEFEEAIEQMAYANDLKLIKRENFYLVEADQLHDSQDARGATKGNKGKSQESEFYFNASSTDKITIRAVNVSISNVINDISRHLKINYSISSEMNEPTTVFLTDVNYDELLSHILIGTKYTYNKNSDIYLIGERQSENIRQTKVIKLDNRSVIDISQIIPQSMSGLVEIREFPELNSLILSGSYPQILEIEQFLDDIDKVVPVILIEVLIVVHKSGFTVSTGIEAGLADKPVKSSGTLIPFDVTMGASSINSIINSFNGLGLINLGKVAPNFYLSLHALEDQGVIDILSTPRLSTLNGHEATLSIGETEYYLEEKSQIFANQTTTQEKIRQFIPVTADFTLTINPIVSGDDQITLDIKVEQSDFTGTRLAPGAPPDQVSRSFNSLIRIRNEEMILLGGLEDKSKSNTGSGVPLLSRIPVLKWFFSSREKKEDIEKLNIFIKPTVIY